MSACATCTHAAEQADRPTDQKTGNPTNHTTQSTRGKHHLLGRGRPAEPHPTGAKRREEKANRKRPLAKGPLAPQADKGTHGEPTPERQRPGSDILAVCGSTEWPQTARSTPGMGQPQSNAHWRAARRRDPWMPGPAGTPVVRRGRPPEHPPSEQGGKGWDQTCDSMRPVPKRHWRKHSVLSAQTRNTCVHVQGVQRRQQLRTRVSAIATCARAAEKCRRAHGPKDQQPR